jgi:hypothetical protein
MTSERRGVSPWNLFPCAPARAVLAKVHWLPDKSEKRAVLKFRALGNGEARTQSHIK